MKEGFRQSMAWLHTWTGLVVGWVLFFVFLTGTMGYIQIELTRWMQPERPMQSQSAAPVTEQMQKAYAWLKNNPDAQQAERWGVNFITNARGGDELRVNWSMPPAEGQSYGAYQRETLDPATGQKQTEQNKPRETGGGGALYYMHYSLHYIPYDWAIRIVGICTMFMFVAIFTGIITHKKIFKDFFTFRGAKGQRSWLDGHNVLSVIALPFHIMITYSGLLFFMNAYMPLGVPLTYGFGDKNQDRYYAELYPQYYSADEDKKQIKGVGESAPSFDKLQPIFYQVEQQLAAGNIGSINIYPAKGNDPAKIQFYPATSDAIARTRQPLEYNLLTGQVLKSDTATTDKAPLAVNNVFLGLHEGLFAGPFLRWMYVITGLVGTAMIATGLILWTVKRRPKQIKAGKMSFGHNAVERLNIGLVAGLPLGIAVYFWANRLLPVAMENRGGWELHTLFITLLIVFIYGCLRPIGRAWFEVLVVTAAALLLLPVLNAITTDKHMWATFIHGDWVLFSIDFGFILVGLVFAWASYILWKKRDAILAKPVAKAKPKRAASLDASSNTATAVAKAEDAS